MSWSDALNMMAPGSFSLRQEILACIERSGKSILVSMHNIQMSISVAFVIDEILLILWKQVKLIKTLYDTLHIVFVVEIFGIDADDTTRSSIGFCSNFGAYS
jgi:hypothetical protein